jgi:hypothetical protein
VDGLASAASFRAERYSAAEPFNVGTGQDLTIVDLAADIARIAGDFMAIIGNETV